VNFARWCEPRCKPVSVSVRSPASTLRTSLDYNDQMRAEIDAERAENIDTPWWDLSPWGGKSEGYWQLKEIETFKHDYETTQPFLLIASTLLSSVIAPNRGAPAWIASTM